MDLELEKNKMIPGFVEGIVKMKIGDTKKLNLKFPEDYSHEDSRGKEAIFEVNLKDLKEKELPELNDDFAKQSGNKDSLKELKKDIENQLKENFDNTQKNIKIELNKFFKKNKINLAVDQKYFPISNNKVSKLNVVFSASFGRQLEYYTGMVFKIDIKFKNSLKNIINGGRYDGLISDLGSKKQTPAVGAALNLNY